VVPACCRFRAFNCYARLETLFAHACVFGKLSVKLFAKGEMMNTLKRSKEAVLYTGLALFIALGATACGDDAGGSREGETPATTTEPVLVQDESFTNFEISDDWSLVDVQYLGQTEFYDGADYLETNQFMLTYEDRLGQELMCLYQRNEDARAGGSSDCNWEAYNQAS